MKNIWETLAADGSFQTMLALLHTAGLEELLQGPGPFTLFAPSDQAFERVKVEELTSDRAQLVKLLEYHLVDGRISAAEIAAHEQLYTRNGKSLTVHLEEGRQVIDNAKFIKTDIQCANGKLHVIDNVFLTQFSGWYCGCC